MNTRRTAWWLDARSPELAILRAKVRLLAQLRKCRRFDAADRLRTEIMDIDPGFRFQMTGGRVVLEHYPKPAFHGYPWEKLNFAIEVATSDEEPT